MSEADARGKDDEGAAYARVPRADPPKVTNPWWSRYEVPRKTLHTSIGFATLAFYRYGATGLSVIQYIVPSLAIIVSADLLRFNNAGFARFYESVLGTLMRPSERRGWNGVIFYLLGVASVLYFLPSDIATLAVLLLSWCDTAASTVGRAYGHLGPDLRKGKSLVGSLAAAVAGSLATWLFFGLVAQSRPEFRSWTPESGLGLGSLSLIGGLVASFSEFVDVWGVDDNLVIPVLSGGLLWTVLVGLGFGC